MKKTSKRIAASPPPSASRPRRPSPSRAPVDRALSDLASVAAREHLRWYVFGAQAVAYHGFPRMTADLDVTIDLGDHALAPVIAAFVAAGFELRYRDPSLAVTTRVLAVVHRASKLPIDLILAGPGLEQVFLDRVVYRTIGRRKIPVISIEDLIVTKLLAGRPKDLEDVRELLRGDVQPKARQIEETLAALEEALAQSDLIPKYRQLVRETRKRA